MAMKKARGNHQSIAVQGPASQLRERSKRGSMEQTDIPAPVGISACERKPAVLHAMPTIRWLLTMHRFQVDAYSDEVIADALLETCPRPDDFWLRSEHLALAIHRVSASRSS